jgi:ubiquinone/menaquinone biosynthesis C-methylase UbiE
MTKSQTSASSDVKGYFTGLASAYADFRPTYPDDAIQWIIDGLPSPLSAADIGCGTGISTRLLANHGVNVIGIDPNADMLGQARRDSASISNLDFQTGTGEITGLASASVGLVVCAQSFHWFDAPAALKEFHRILKPGGRLALMWNWKLTGHHGDEAGPFSVEFTRIMQAAQADAVKRGLKTPSEREADPTIGGFFTNTRQNRFPNPQTLDQQGMLGRAHSASYFPRSGPVKEQLDRELLAAFEANQRDGNVILNHMTEVTIADRA